MSLVMEVDYPNEWPNLVSEVLESMRKANKPEELYGCLVVSKALVSTYKRTLDQERAPLEFIIENLFPLLENLLVNQMNNKDAFAAKMCHLILSIFCMANWMQFSRYLNADKLRIWMVAIKHLLHREMPRDFSAKLTSWDDIIKRSEEPEWKIKANCMKIVSR
jgi:hypothetical protein